MAQEVRRQEMKPAEQEGVMWQATEGRMSLDDFAQLAVRAKVKTVVLSHRTQPDGTDDYTP